MLIWRMKRKHTHTHTHIYIYICYLAAVTTGRTQRCRCCSHWLETWRITQRVVTCWFSSREATEFVRTRKVTEVDRQVKSTHETNNITLSLLAAHREERERDERKRSTLVDAIVIRTMTYECDLSLCMWMINDWTKRNLLVEPTTSVNMRKRQVQCRQQSSSNDDSSIVCFLIDHRRRRRRRIRPVQSHSTRTSSCLILDE
jgi:hypothetical protein